MTNLRAELEEAEQFYGERIEAMVVGILDEYPYRNKPEADEHIVLRREDGLRKVDREYDSGFGGADCHPLYAWTASRVFFVHEYDGATSLMFAPRYPMPVEASFGGQSPAMDEIDRIVAARNAATR